MNQEKTVKLMIWFQDLRSVHISIQEMNVQVTTYLKKSTSARTFSTDTHQSLVLVSQLNSLRVLHSSYHYQEKAIKIFINKSMLLLPLIINDQLPSPVSTAKQFDYLLARPNSRAGFRISRLLNPTEQNVKDTEKRGGGGGSDLAFERGLCRSEERPSQRRAEVVATVRLVRP
ncbi:uncharacterized protein LOC100381632 [Zea mays]|jgi:hypothetical protein|uniref:Uncharacterized protein n=1 Tax=Zea mays TaxID=4577 RepID=C0HHM8_MAIZE|nr:uncharacterized protein LOC100381632 [Zea mays]ACN26531.1 unknown [Zea mays]|eukprot:NP_001167920.1 uncharacterized protein LOC100381632 [Zea mays]